MQDNLVIMSVIREILRFGAIFNFAFALYFELWVIEFPPNAHRNKFGGPWKYLTFLNLWLQLGYFLMAVLQSILPRLGLLKKARDFFFATLGFPIGMCTGITFWGLYAIDRELVYSKKNDAFYPSYLNHMCHTTVVPFVMLELYFGLHKYPKALTGAITTGFFCLLYFSWTLYVAYFGGIWVYPIFKVMSPFMRGVFIAICCFLGVSIFLLGNWLNKLSLTSSKKNKKSRKARSSSSSLGAKKTKSQ